MHPFDDPHVAAGQGTLGLEMMEQTPDLDCVVVPIGGGGLIAGVATAVKGINPDIEVIGAQAELYAAVEAELNGGTNGPEGGSTLAEGIAVKSPAKDNLDVIERLVSHIDIAMRLRLKLPWPIFTGKLMWKAWRWPYGYSKEY